MYDRASHIFSVDVEEYFQVSAFDGSIDRASWSSFPSRVAASVDWLLETLDQHHARATFFVLGCLVGQHADLVRRIQDAGHEIASHGWSHRKLTSLSRADFAEELRSSKEALEWVTGAPVIGFRAPSFSLVPGLEWAFDVLLEQGYQYDSSLFPIRRPGYGYPGTPAEPHEITRAGGTLIEFPLTVMSVGGANLPAAGGGYFRHFPYAMTRAALRAYGRRGIPGMFYIHPWEVDPLQPRLAAPALQRLRHYGGIAGTRERLLRLLAEFSFTSVAAMMQPSPLASVPGVSAYAR
jgi:polysaccharide deacetylase family protein (PEP-CTERM system associated)